MCDLRILPAKYKQAIQTVIKHFSILFKLHALFSLQAPPVLYQFLNIYDVSSVANCGGFIALSQFEVNTHFTALKLVVLVLWIDHILETFIDFNQHIFKSHSNGQMYEILDIAIVISCIVMVQP